MLNFSCADFTFPVLDRLTALQLIKLLGFGFVDIGLFARSTHFSPAELGSCGSAYTRGVQSDLDAAEIRVSDVFLQIGVDPPEHAANDPDPAVRAGNRDAFQRALEFCVKLGCGHMTGLPGVFHAGVAPERDLDLAVEVAGWRVQECAKAEVVYAIEPHVGSICADVESTQLLLAQAPGLTLTLDYGHFIMAGESSVRVHELLPAASHIHVRGGAPGRLQTSVKENKIDFEGMSAALRRQAYDGFLALEYVWIDWNECNRTDNISETVLLRRALEAAYLALEEPA